MECTQFDNLNIMMKLTKAYCPFMALAVLCTACFLFSSCSPWDGELEEIYEAAQNGDRLSRFAIIEEYNSFEDIVPEDTIQTYLWEFVREGNRRAIELGAVMEVSKLDHTQIDKYIEQSDKIDLKWDNEGVKYNNYVSYKHLGDRQMEKYRQTGHVQDSLKAEELYQKAIAAGNMHLRMERDAKAGLKAIVMGGIEYAEFSYENTFSENSPIMRFVRSCSYAFSYIVSAAIKLLFTSMWWKVILLLLGMFLLLMFFIFLCVHVLAHGDNTKREESVARWGIFFGFWNSMCFFTAISRNNLVWMNTTTSFIFPPSAYGLQQYLSIIMNWIALIYLVIVVLITIIYGCRKQKGIGSISLNVLSKVAIFILAYLIAQVGGYLMLIVLIAMVIMYFSVGVVVTAPATVTDLAFDSADYILNSTLDAMQGKSCRTCLYWDSEHDTCPNCNKVTERNVCKYWESDLLNSD